MCIRDSTWANFRPWSSDGAPLVGDGGVKNLTLATGHYRSGILLAPATAERVRAHVIEGRTETGVPWDPGQPSRRPGAEAIP